MYIYKKISLKDAWDFIESNSIHKYDSDIYLGMYNNTDLIGICQVNLRGNNDIEIVNTVCRKDLSIKDYVEKIQEYLKSIYKCSEIKVKIDLSKYNGMEYINAGFVIQEIEPPTFVCVDTSTDLLTDITEITNNGYNIDDIDNLIKLYNCGKIILKH